MLPVKKIIYYAGRGFSITRIFDKIHSSEKILVFVIFLYRIVYIF